MVSPHYTEVQREVPLSPEKGGSLHSCPHFCSPRVLEGREFLARLSAAFAAPGQLLS